MKLTGLPAWVYLELQLQEITFHSLSSYGYVLPIIFLVALNKLRYF